MFCSIFGEIVYMCDNLKENNFLFDSVMIFESESFCRIISLYNQCVIETVHVLDILW